MARQDAKMATSVRYQHQQHHQHHSQHRGHHHHLQPCQPKRKLEYLLNETYVKIDELKELLRKEKALTGIDGSRDGAVGRMFSRQDYLITLCAEACCESEKNKTTSGPPAPKPGPSSSRSYVPQPQCSAITEIADRESSQKGDGGGGGGGGSWYGSLDRSLAKKKKHQLLDKRRRHTKTIGSMAGLDVLKKQELKPDEQYEIGLPAAPRVTSTRSSIFPMTQHQYYTALMESKLNKKPVAYPLDVRQQAYQPNHHNHQHLHHHHHPSAPVVPPGRQLVGNNWGVDENKNMKKPPVPPEVPQHPQPPVVQKSSANLVPLPCRSLGNSSEMSFRYSAVPSGGGKGNSSPGGKKWYETNLDEGTGTPTSGPAVVTLTAPQQNVSPSPSMLSSTRGSSRGSVASGIDTIDGSSGIQRLHINSPNESADFNSKSSESSESWSGTIAGGNNEVTKPFEMSDYYKYSTKFRSRNSPGSEEGNQSDRVSIGPLSSSTSVSTSVGPPPPTAHSRQSSQSRDTNGNPPQHPPPTQSAPGPKLPPKQHRRNQNRSISTSSVIFEGDLANGDGVGGVGGDPSKDIWITNEPTFV